MPAQRWTMRSWLRPAGTREYQPAIDELLDDGNP
jgi:hypothetical protein